jgi:hypothetical protein
MSDLNIRYALRIRPHSTLAQLCARRKRTETARPINVRIIQKIATPLSVLRQLLIDAKRSNSLVSGSFSAYPHWQRTSDDSWDLAHNRHFIGNASLKGCGRAGVQGILPRTRGAGNYSAEITITEGGDL